MKARIGRVLSIAGHPFILTPLAVTIATWRETARSRAVILGLLAAAMLAVAIHVVRRHRRGEVADIDVSAREQRPAVFRVAIGSLLVVMLALHFTGANPAALRGAAVATGLFVACAFANLKVKVSLHSAFAVLAAGIVWPVNHLGGIAFGIAAGLIGWGRIAYQRHTPIEVVLGLLLGTAAAVTLVSIL
ncbi:MAG: phosphatase PAP2 family protein [Labilithrix sp.]